MPISSGNSGPSFGASQNDAVPSPCVHNRLPRKRLPICALMSTRTIAATWKFHLTPVLCWMGPTHSPRFNMSGSLAMFDATRLASSIVICFTSMASASVERP